MLPEWLITAFRELGTSEIAGEEDNPRISEYLSTVGQGSDDEIPWCSAFVNWCLGQECVQGTDAANARSWQSWGVRLEEPRLGCVAVLWRQNINSWKGHVGFYCGMSGRNIILLGGNQANKVSLKLYPETRVLSYRWFKT